MTAIDVFWRCCGAFGVLIIIGFSVYWSRLIVEHLDRKWRA